jgi:hypothetical protein
MFLLEIMDTVVTESQSDSRILKKNIAEAKQRCAEESLDSENTDSDSESSSHSAHSSVKRRKTAELTTES